MKKKNTPLYAKLLLSLFSLLFFLTVLEVGLWAAGQMFYEHDEEYRDDESAVISQLNSGTEIVDIMAVGDSFTHGGFVEGHETYTSHLRNVLKMNDRTNVRVHNNGICELNTHELVKRFPKMIADINPKAVLLLVGATNRFNPWDYEAYANKNSLAGIISWFFDRRVVKMARFIKLNVQHNQSSRSDLQKKSFIIRNLNSRRSINSRHDRHMEYIERWKNIKEVPEGHVLQGAWKLFNQGLANEAIIAVEEGLDKRTIPHEEGYLSLVHFYYKMDNLNRAEGLLLKTYKDNEHSQFVFDAMAYYYFEFANWYKKKFKYHVAIDYYLKAIAVDPDTDYFYSEMNKIYELQSYYDSQLMYQKLVALNEANPFLSMSKNFTNHLGLYKDKQKWEAGIEEWVYDDLKEIAEMCRKKGIVLVIQNYPTDYVMANRVLTKISKEYDFPLVDHQSVFKPMEPKNKYFFDDDHCTNIGHKVMAQTIYQTLVKEELLN